MNEEILDSFNSSKYTSLVSNKPNKESQELSSSHNELNEARQQLRLLEMKIQTLENRIAKKYPDVLFLNYKDRKRILVIESQNSMNIYILIAQNYQFQ